MSSIYSCIKSIFSKWASECPPLEPRVYKFLGRRADGITGTLTVDLSTSTKMYAYYRRGVTGCIAGISEYRQQVSVHKTVKGSYVMVTRSLERDRLFDEPSIELITEITAIREYRFHKHHSATDPKGIRFIYVDPKWAKEHDEPEEV